MKYEKINTGIIVDEIEDKDPVSIVDHSIIGLAVDESETHAAVYNIIQTVEKGTNDEGEIVDIPKFIGLKTRYVIESDEDKEYLKTLGINMDNMDAGTLEKAKAIMSSIYALDSYYSDLTPIMWDDSDKDNVKVTIKGYHIVSVDGEAKTYSTKFILPFGTYIMMAKIKSDLICNIDINAYYTFSSNDFKYIEKNIDKITYLGSELAGKDDDGYTKAISMYNIAGDDISEYLTIPFSTNEKINIHKEKTIKEFAEEHKVFFNFDLRAFLYYEKSNKTKSTIPAILIYDANNKTYMVYNISDDVLEEIFNPDKEVK